MNKRVTCEILPENRSKESLASDGPFLLGYYNHMSIWKDKSSITEGYNTYFDQYNFAINRGTVIRRW